MAVIVGTSDADDLLGTAGDDTITGLAGDDKIESLGGNDTIFGDDGNDYIEVSSGILVIEGGDDYDTIDTRRFDDTEDDTTITYAGGGAGILATNGTSGIDFDSIERFNLGVTGTISVIGDETNNDISIYDFFDALEFDGGAGEDDLEVHQFDLAGDDARGLTRAEFESFYRLERSVNDGSIQLILIETGAIVGVLRNVENIRFAGAESGDTERVSLNELTDNTNIVGTLFDDTLVGTSGDDTMTGLAGDDRLSALDGNDTLYGGDGEDRLYGGNGDDFIVVGENDNAYGGNGDDTFDLSAQTFGWGSYIRPGLGRDTITGSQALFDSGEGHDLSYEGLSGIGGVTITSGENGTGTVVSGTAGHVDDTFSFFHYFVGSQDDDTIIGSDTTSWEGLRGEGGNDSIDGGGGFDELIYTEAHWNAANPGAVTVNFDTGMATDVHGDTDTFKNIEAVRGTDLDDTFTGTDKQDYVRYRGLGGDDTIMGDAVGYDILDHSRDTAEGGGLGLNANLATGIVIDGFGDTDTVSNIDQIRGTHFADIMLGGSQSVKFRGMGGDDQLTGGSANDELIGGAGNNTLDGGAGSDFAYYGTDFGSVTIAQVGDAISVAGTGDDGAFADIVTQVEYFGFDDENLSLGQIQSGTTNGDNVVDLSGSTTNEVVVSGGGNDDVTGGAGDDQITTGGGNDIVNAGAGNDQVIDLSGNDQVNGGAGNDVGVLLSGNNIFTDAADQGTSSTDRTINDFYCGGYGDDVFASMGGNDLLIADVGTAFFAGKDRLDGGSGDDVMQGGFNADVFIFADGHGNDTIARVNLEILPLNLSTITIDDVPLITSQADFEIGIDLMDLSAITGLTGFSDLSITDGTHGAIIDTGAGTINVFDIVASDFTADQFIF